MLYDNSKYHKKGNDDFIEFKSAINVTHQVLTFLNGTI